MRIVAVHVRSGIAALNVVTGALEADARTAGLDVRFVRSRDAAVDAIVSATPDVAAASAKVAPVIVAWSFYSPDFTAAAADLAEIRARAPGALHIAGGVHATAEPRATLRAGFDLVAVGEGEATFVELVARVRRGDDPRVTPGLAWLDPGGSLCTSGAAPRLPLDAFPACNLRFGKWNALEVTRGCVYACSFCQTPFMFKARFRHRSVDDVRHHVRAMQPRYVRYVSPTSLSYGSSDERVDLAAVEALLAAVRAELPAGGKQYFGTFPSEVRPEHVTPEALAVIARWCDNRSLVIGGQTGSQRLLDATHRGHTVDDVVRAVEVAVSSGFRPDVDLLLGLPGETADDRALTVALAERLAGLGARLHSHAFMPLPGTPLKDAEPAPIEPEVAAAMERLEGRGAAYGQWRAQQVIAADLVRHRRAARAR
jgi:B12-binding domain/radical SAM domain protein